MKKIMKKYLTGSKALIVLWAVISMIIIAPSCVKAQVTGDYYYDVLEDGGISVYSYKGTETVLRIPETIDGYTVTVVGSNILLENDTVEEVVIPDTVKIIKPQAFWNKSGIKKIELGNSVEEIGYQAFFGCDSLESINIPDTCKSIGSAAFFRCSSLGEIHIPASVEKLGISYNLTKPSNIFESAYNLKSVTVDENNPRYTCIDGVLYGKDDNGNLIDLIFYPFSKQDNIYEIPDGIQYIAGSACASAKFEKVIIPDSVKTISKDAFEKCASLTTVEGGKGLKKIEYEAFGYCESLTAFELSDTLTYIESGAFIGATSYVPVYPAHLEKNESGDYVKGMSFSISGNTDYEKAFECLRLVNQERSAQGLTPLTMNETLMSEAMQRAAECAVNFDHYRPDGTKCYTIAEEGGPAVNAENIAANQRTAESVMESWMNSAGHKANILGSTYNSVGIGCVNHNGIIYWVQLFSTDETTNEALKPENENDKEFFIKYNSGGVALSLFLNSDSNISLTENDTKKLYLCGKNAGWTSVSFVMNGKYAEWQSSDTNVVKADNNGNITAVGAGEATITASFGEMFSGTVKVTVSHLWNEEIVKTIPGTSIHVPADYRVIEHSALYNTIIRPKYKTSVIPAEPDSVEVYDTKYVWVKPKYKTVKHKKGTTDKYLLYKKPVYSKKKISAKQWTYKHEEMYKYVDALASETEGEYIDLCECSCGKIFTKDEYEKHKKDGEDAYSAAQASETIDEYMNGPYGKCGTVSEVTKKTEASTVEYKAAKIITKKAWTEKLSYKSPSYTRYGALKSGGLKNSKYVKKYNKKSWTEKRVIKDGYWKKVKYNKHKLQINGNKSYEIKVPTGSVETVSGNLLVEPAWNENVITNESTLETTPPKDVKTGVICEKCGEIKCLFCDEIFNDRELFDKHSCNSAS